MSTGFKFQENGIVYDVDQYLVRKDIFERNGIWLWGNNQYGQLGDNTKISKSSPINIDNGKTWQSISGGDTHFHAIKTNGTLWAWGRNSPRGNLGFNDTIDRSSPVQVGDLTNWKQVSCGYSWTIMLQNNGTLWGCGNNSSGQLGDNTIVDKSSPVQIGSDISWRSISSGSGHNLGISNDNILYSWGLNNNGRLGLNDTSNRSIPTIVATDVNIKYIRATMECSFYINTDGSLWGCGSGNSGRLGLNDTSNRSVFTQIGTDLNWKKVETGHGGHTIAIKTDNTLWAWGINSYGQLGDGTTISKSSPIQIGSLTDWKNIHCGYMSTIAIKTDGTLWAWGRNHFGQLGDGTTISKSSPIQIGGITALRIAGSRAIAII